MMMLTSTIILNINVHIFCSRLIKGLVFKKHAAHKHMITKYTNARLLLIQGMLGSSSGSSGLSSFNSMISEVK